MSINKGFRIITLILLFIGTGTGIFKLYSYFTAQQATNAAQRATDQAEMKYILAQQATNEGTMRQISEDHGFFQGSLEAKLKAIPENGRKIEELRLETKADFKTLRAENKADLNIVRNDIKTVLTHLSAP